MAKLEKAMPQQAYMKASFYGPQGSGKTFTALLIAEGLAKQSDRRIAFIDTERGTDFYAQAIKERPIHPEAFDFDALYTRSLSDALDMMRNLDTKKYGAVVIDSMSHIWDAAIAAYEGKRTKIESIPIHAWGPIKKPYKELIQRGMDMPIHLFLLGRQKNVFSNEGGGEWVKEGVTMRAEGETPYEPHLCFRFESVKRPDGTCSGVLMICEKDRSSILHGRTIPNPTFDTFAPILPYLGDVQAVSEDADEVAARDSDLLAEGERKAIDKRDKSAALYTDLNGKLATAGDLDALNVVALEIKKAKRYLTSEHEAALRLVYGNRRDQLTAEKTPKEI